MSELKEEWIRSPIERLQERVENLSESYVEVTQRVHVLEEVNWQLTDRVVKVENTLVSCASLLATDPKVWDISTVSFWLHKYGLDVYERDFAEAGIDGEALLACDEQRLQELDIRRQHRPIILDGISDLQKKWDDGGNEVVFVNPQNSPLLSAKKNDPSAMIASPDHFRLKESFVVVSPVRFLPEGEGQSQSYLKPCIAVIDNYVEVHMDHRSMGEIGHNGPNTPYFDDEWELVEDIR